MWTEQQQRDYIERILSRYTKSYHLHISQVSNDLQQCIMSCYEDMSGCQFADFVNSIVYFEAFKLNPLTRYMHFEDCEASDDGGDND